MFLVRHRDGKDYALKTMNKHWTVHCHQETSVFRERELMTLVDHPFVAHCFATCQDSKCIYIVQQAVMGGDLWQFLHETLKAKRPPLKVTSLGGLNAQQAVFYASQVLSVLENIHARNITHRDLKPENWVIFALTYKIF